MNHSHEGIDRIEEVLEDGLALVQGGKECSSVVSGMHHSCHYRRSCWHICSFGATPIVQQARHILDFFRHCCPKHTAEVDGRTRDKYLRAYATRYPLTVERDDRRFICGNLGAIVMCSHRLDQLFQSGQSCVKVFLGCLIWDQVC